MYHKVVALKYKHISQPDGYMVKQSFTILKDPDSIPNHIPPVLKGGSGSETSSLIKTNLRST